MDNNEQAYLEIGRLLAQGFLMHVNHLHNITQAYCRVVPALEEKELPEAELTAPEKDVL